MAQSPLHTPKATARRAAARPAQTLTLLFVAAVPLCGPLCGCSVSFPIAPLTGGDEVTGSESPVPFGRLLDEEDRRREKAALSTALDPQGDGATVRWENEKSGAKGAITAVGRAYPSDGKICRAFLGDLAREMMHRTLQGTACAVAAGDWQLREAKPAGRKPQG